jgi:hypothetical protein
MECISISHFLYSHSFYLSIIAAHHTSAFSLRFTFLFLLVVAELFTLTVGKGLVTTTTNDTNLQKLIHEIVSSVQVTFKILMRVGLLAI